VQSDWEINLELARRFNPAAIKYKSVKELINDRLKPAGVTFDEMAEKGSWLMPPKGHSRNPIDVTRRDCCVPMEAGIQHAYRQGGTLVKKYEEWSLDPLPITKSRLRARCGPLNSSRSIPW